MHTVREGSSGDMGARANKGGKSKKSNWDLAGKGKGKGHLKGDLDEKAPKRPLSVTSGQGKGNEVKKKKV